MGRTKFAELDRITFNRIRKTKNANGMIDEKRFFGDLSIGDSVVFSCDGRKIEAYLRDIKIYRTLGEYIKENGDNGVLEINSKNPLDFLNLMTQLKGGEVKDNKRVRIFEVDYHPYGDDDDETEEDNIGDGGEDANIEDFISSLLNAGGGGFSKF